MIRNSILTALATTLLLCNVSAQNVAFFNNSYYNSFSTGGYNPGFIPGLYVNNPYTGQSFNYNWTSRVTLGADYINPVTGYRNYFYYNNTVSGAFLPGIPGVSPYAPYSYPLAAAYGSGLGGGYLSGGVGTYGVAANNATFNPVVQEQVRLLKAAGGRGNANDVEARKMIADQWAYEQRAKAVIAPAAAKPVIQEATEDQILSGKAINELAAAIRSAEGRGTKATAPLISADLLSHVAYAAGASTDLMDLAAAGKIEFPEPLAGQQWLGLRGDLQKAAAPVLEAAAAGKKVPAAAGEKLAAEVKTARKDAAPLLRDLSFPEATELTRFFNRLDSLAKLGSDATLNGAYVPAWTTVGASLNEYVKHLGKYNIAVAPRKDGDDDAYFALYKAMLDYYTGLIAKK